MQTNNLERNGSTLDLLTLNEVAAILRSDPTTVGRRVKSGELPAVHIGRRVLIRRQDLEVFVDEHLGGG
jgi:excisionase family DNA binding protein